MRGPRIGALAGVGFVAVGVVELALTGGPSPDPPAVLGSVDFFSSTSDVAPAVAVLSALAGALYLLFAVQLRRCIADRALARLAWAGAVATVVLAWAGQAAQQVAWLAAGDLDGSAVAALGALTGFLFGFALVGGGVLAVAVAVAALREEPLPTWLAALGFVAAIVAVVVLAVPSSAGIAFPVFLVWLLAASAVLARQPAAVASSTTGTTTSPA